MKSKIKKGMVIMNYELGIMNWGSREWGVGRFFSVFSKQ
ncbi:hypothetical protein MYAER_1645 [Microcystis aeruginosa NIES-2549]|uniref:Uncharacterized protein n=1 Tax=Microcystis aeruginosa NIES-2549 TaxID=1641812 RepID=A0A0F6U324_MICAE|nr:hypothetical protein MYAER_1645 [Microcystis aeruginosa NIES-2549]